MFNRHIVLCLLSTNRFLHSYITNNLTNKKADISCSDVTISKKEN